MAIIMWTNIIKRYKEMAQKENKKQLYSYTSNMQMTTDIQYSTLIYMKSSKMHYRNTN